MDKEKMIDCLTNLAQLDIDAFFAYEQALKNIDQQDIYDKIDKFRQDHQRHINDLGKLINEYGGTPPTQSKDFKGYLIEGMTMIRSLTGVNGALSAMETNEELTNKRYKEALDAADKGNFPAAVKDLIERNYGDEKRHLQYIRETLEVLENV